MSSLFMTLVIMAREIPYQVSEQLSLVLPDSLENM